MENDIHDQLIAAIKGSRLTLYRIAKDTEINHTALSRFVNGTNPDIRLTTVQKLANYFGFSFENRGITVTAKRVEKRKAKGSG